MSKNLIDMRFFHNLKNHPIIPLLLTIVVFGFFLFSSLNFVTVGDGYEFRAEIAREMMVQGNYLVPTLGGTLKLTKPPLYYDYIIMFYKIFGSTNLFVARLSSIFASLAVLLSVAFYAKRFLNLKNPYWLLLILFFQPLYLYFSRRVETDMFLSLEILLMFISMHVALRFNRPYLKTLSYLLLALVFFTKGPIIILFIAMWLLLYRISYGKEYFLEQCKKIVDWKGIIVLLGIFAFFIVNYIPIKDQFIAKGVSEVGIRFPLISYLKNPLLLLYFFIIKNPLEFILHLFPFTLFLYYLKTIKDPAYKIIKIMFCGIVLSIFLFAEVNNNYYVPAIPFLAILVSKLLSEHNQRIDKLTIFIVILMTSLLCFLFYFLVPIYGLTVYLAILALSISIIVLVLFSPYKRIPFVLSLALFSFILFNYIDPLDQSNEYKIYYKQIGNEFNLNNNIPIYRFSGNKAAFAFGLKKITKHVPQDKLGSTLKEDGECYIVIDKQQESEFIQQSPDIIIMKELPFKSKFAESVYPKILDKFPLEVKIDTPDYNFMWLKSKTQ